MATRAAKRPVPPVASGTARRPRAGGSPAVACTQCGGSGRIHAGWCKDAGAITVPCACGRSTQRVLTPGFYFVCTCLVIALGWLLIA